MSVKDGLAALNLEMPNRVPRTEYSANGHWQLVSKVTGIDVTSDSTVEVMQSATSAFVKAWNYDFVWATRISKKVFGDICTNMGHAVFAQDGVDFDKDCSSAFNDTDEVLNFDPYKQLGKRNKSELISDFNNHYKNQCQLFPDAVNMTGIYISCMSGLIDLFGWDLLLMSAGEDSKSFGHMTNRYADWILQYFEALAQSDSPVVMIHDDIVWTQGPFLHPSWYREFIFPNYRKLFASLIANNKKIIYTSDGNYTEFIDDIANCGINGFVLEPLTDMKYIAEKYGKTHAFIGNADTNVLLRGTKDDIFREVKRCMDIGKKCPGFFMAVGNHIPANTPVDNALYYNETYEKLSIR